MLPLFCLRLALGLLVALLVLPSAVIHPRFYRTHFLTVLGLCCVALVPILKDGYDVPRALFVAAGLSFLGAVVWSLEGAPGGRVLILLTIAALAVTMHHPPEGSWRSTLLAGHRQWGAWTVAD